jgi:hypothetical protein
LHTSILAYWTLFFCILREQLTLLQEATFSFEAAIAAEEISNQAVAEALGGLPPIKMHCSNLAANALHEAIKNYKNKK